MFGFKNQDASFNDLNVANADHLPGDTISSLAWCPNVQHRLFVCSSWDSKIRLYDTAIGTQQKGLVLKGALQVEDPCISLCWADDMSKFFAGCINNTVKAFDPVTGQSVDVGKHDAAVRDVFWINSANTLMTTSFDKTIRFWDLRQQNPVAGFNVGQKIYCADMCSPLFAMGLSDEKLLVVNLHDIQNMLNKTPLDYIDSPLGQTSQLTSVGFFSDGSGIGIGSHDGRANLSKLEMDNRGRPKLANIMTFKCHKIDAGSSLSQTTLYPVHGIGFHPKSKNFVYTAGGEGNIYFWDYVAKNKIKGFDYKGVPVTKVKMSPDGLLMAYGLGYDWSKGIEGYMSHKPKLCVHVMQEAELIYKG